MKIPTIIPFSVSLIISLYLAAFSSTSFSERDYSVTSNEIDTLAEKYRKSIDSLFRIGYNDYENRDFLSALSSFNKLIVKDTSLIQYEDYAFAADCYKRLGNVEKGYVLYDSLISRLRTRVLRDTDSYDLQISLSESRYMKSLYPTFPTFLEKENGFIPVDSFPRVLQSKAPVYPEYEKYNKREGDVIVRLRLSGLGEIKNIIILYSSGDPFTRSILRMLPSWKFSPYKRKGRLSEIEITIPFRFRLGGHY